MDTNNLEESRANDIQLSNNVNASELDYETNIKLRGDAIGDTLYSQSFVLKTLLQFSDLKWSEDVENDLCFIWDMTVEKDVCKYLFEVSFPSLACSALETYSESRFIEIVVGILANILCADCDKSITQDEINIILRELDTDDHLILIQVVRFISAVAHILQDLSFISSIILDKIIFILYNSTNTELLIKGLEAVCKITTDFKLDKNLVTIEIVTSSLTAYKSVVNDSDAFSLDTKDKQLACKYVLQIISNCCAYSEQFNQCALLLLEFKNCSNVFLNEIVKILKYFSQEENLVPVSDEFIFYMSALRFVLESLNVKYVSGIFLPLIKILYIISDFKDEVVELFDIIIELVCFFFASGTSEVLCKDLKMLSKNKVTRVLFILNENEQAFHIESKLKYVSDKFK